MHVCGRSRLSLLGFVIGKKRAHLLPKREAKGAWPFS